MMECKPLMRISHRKRRVSPPPHLHTRSLNLGIAESHSRSPQNTIANTIRMNIVPLPLPPPLVIHSHTPNAGRWKDKPLDTCTPGVSAAKAPILPATHAQAHTHTRARTHRHPCARARTHIGLGVYESRIVFQGNKRGKKGGT
jgi:hypothetical protein